AERDIRIEVARYRLRARHDERHPFHRVVVGPCKTESSQKPVPMHPTLADALIQWRKRCTYVKPEDWVFASKRYRGRRPYWGQAILRKDVRPAAQRVGIQKRFGWHTFRHSYSTLLRSVGTEFKVMQELLRHSSFRSTLDVYTQAVTPAKHAAQAAVMSLVFSSDKSGGTLVARYVVPAILSKRISSKPSRARKGHVSRPFCAHCG